MTQMLVCNDTSTRIGIIQIETKKPQVVLGRQCFEFNWTTQKARPVSCKQYTSKISNWVNTYQLITLLYSKECCVGLFHGNNWIWSSCFGTSRSGLSMRKVGHQKVFIKNERLYASQRLVRKPFNTQFLENRLLDFTFITYAKSLFFFFFFLDYNLRWIHSCERVGLVDWRWTSQ